METERIHHLTEQKNLVQRACFMHSDKSFSERSCFDPEPLDLCDNFSATRAVKVEVQECLKRSLVGDRNSAVPFKKRKQLHEKSDCCDVSFDQIIKKSDNDEEINENFKKENYDEPIPNTSQKLSKDQIEFDLQSSVFVKVDDSMEWIRLKCFESTVMEESKCATFFAGGPIQSSAFFVTPRGIEVNQYIAVSVSNAISNKHSYNDTNAVSGLIQFWNLGSLHKGKLLNQLPSMELALYHDIGIITELKWCPSDCYDKYPSTGYLPRLGLLAASSLDSCVYIYSVPQPNFMPKLKPTFPIYFTQPSWKLIPLFGGPSNATRKAAATCIDWEKNGERIVAGYGNGSICVWMIKVSSFASYIGMKSVDQSFIIQPYLFFQAARTPIRSLSFAPFSNHRWLVVLSVDGFARFFDLLDTTSPFKILKQGLDNSCIWGDSFCGVYSSPIINQLGLISLSATDCSFENPWEKKGSSFETNQKKEKERKLARTIQKTGLFDSSALLFETEIIALHTVDLELKNMQSKISITGNILRNEIRLVNDSKGSLHAEIKQESSASSSSSGFCSPKNDKTIVIDTDQCFASDTVHLMKSPSKSSVNDLKDNNNNRIKAFSNKIMKCGETNDEMIKYSDFSEDLMRDLLMAKVSRQSKSSSHIFPVNRSNNSAIYYDSNCAKYISGDLITSSAPSDYTGDTIVYPVEDYYCDTSHLNTLKSCKSNEQSEYFGLEEKTNALHENTINKFNRKSTLDHQLFSENSLNFSCSEVKSGNSFSNENSSSNYKSELNTKNYQCNYENMNLKKNNNYSSAHSSSFICKNLKGKKLDSKKSSKEIMKNENIPNLGAKSNLISKKATKNFASHKNFDVLKLTNSNHPTSFENMYSCTRSNDSIISDIDDKKLSIQALNQSSAASDYSGDTIIYSFDACDYCDVKYLKSNQTHDAISQSLSKKEPENTFQNISLHKMEEKAVLCESKAKLLVEDNCSLTRVKCENLLAKKLLKCNSAYETETDSATECSSLNDKDGNFDCKNILISNFHLLQSEHFYDKSKENLTVLNKQPQSGKNPQKLSYENLISNFGVIFKNNLNKPGNILKNQKNDIFVEYNPLSVIKTISWNPNNGCQSWLFVGGNSGIGRLVFVQNFLGGKKEKAL